MASLGIPTKYRGYQFRSRAEARWAAFFDQLGWSWAYEPVDLDGYIPDFVLGERLLVEVKGAALSCNDLKAFSPDLNKRVKLLLPARPTFHWDVYAGKEWVSHTQLGSARLDPEVGQEWTYAHLRRCPECKKDTPWHSWGGPYEAGMYKGMDSDGCLLCGELMPGGTGPHCGGQFYQGLWAQACNLTQWKAPV